MSTTSQTARPSFDSYQRPIIEIEAFEANKCTLYASGCFGWIATACRIVKLEGDRITYVEKGKRKARAVRASAGVLVVGGQQAPEVRSAFNVSDTGMGFTSRMTRHGSFDPAWTREFWEQFGPLIESDAVAVLYDSRTKGKPAPPECWD